MTYKFQSIIEINQNHDIEEIIKTAESYDLGWEMDDYGDLVIHDYDHYNWAIDHVSSQFQ